MHVLRYNILGTSTLYYYYYLVLVLLVVAMKEGKLVIMFSIRKNVKKDEGYSDL